MSNAKPPAPVPVPTAPIARGAKVWQWLLGTVLLPALAAMLLFLFAPARLALAWNWMWSALLPADTRLYQVTNVPWTRDQQVWKIGEDPTPLTHAAVATISVIVSTKVPEGTAIEVIARISPDHSDDACPRIRMVSVQTPIYVPVHCVVKLEAGSKYTYSVWIRPDSNPQPDGGTPSWIRGSILITNARF